MHNKTGTKHKRPINNGGNNKQLINNNINIALEWSAEVTGGLKSFYCQIFSLVPYSALVKLEKMLKLVWGYLSNVSSRVNNHIYKHTELQQRTWHSTQRQSELKKQRS